MKKKILLITIFLLFFISYIIAENNEKYIVEENFSSSAFSVYKIYGSEKKLIKNISYDDFQYRHGYIFTKEYLYFVNYENNLIRFSLHKNKIENTKIKIMQGFSVSDNDEFVCVHEKSILLNSSKTLIPVIYNLKTRKKNSITGLPLEILLNDIGVSLSTTYNGNENTFDIRYNWDTPTPSFSGKIYLNDFTGFLDVFSSPYIKYYGEVVRGKINDTNVRLRETPSLDGKIICLLKTGTNVRLNARTKEEQAIGNMKSLWYNISVQDNYGNDVSGWMYGAYLDIEKPEK